MVKRTSMSDFLFLFYFNISLQLPEPRGTIHFYDCEGPQQTLSVGALIGFKTNIDTNPEIDVFVNKFGKVGQGVV